RNCMGAEVSFVLGRITHTPETSRTPMNANSGRNLLAALTLLASASLVTHAAAQEAAASDTKKDETVKLEKFVVIGTHISGIDMAGLSPVVGISRADLALGGYSTIGDAL